MVIRTRFSAHGDLCERELVWALQMLQSFKYHTSFVFGVCELPERWLRKQEVALLEIRRAAVVPDAYQIDETTPFTF